MLPRGLLQRQYAVTVALVSAFLTDSKIMKYDDLRSNIDMNRQTGKSLRKAIAEADKALEL